nr:tRNA (cytosine-5-)-methyltransferase [Leptinotarsa decemlineata]
MNVLELYSGIGGMHLALLESGVKGNIVASIEISNVANEIYKLNFPNTPLFNSNIEGLTPEFIEKLNIDTIFMSPPCQPFTRNGLQNDIKDPRTASFLHILEILPDLNIQNILIENVKGFEKSIMRDMLVDTLTKSNFIFQEFILSPHQMGIPNSRHRYYCLGKKLPSSFSFEIEPMMESFPAFKVVPECYSIEEILEADTNQKYLLSENILNKRFNVLDICHKNSRRSCCFTKAYGRFIEGTGSVFTPRSEKEVTEIYTLAKSSDLNSDSRLELLKSLQLRFFTPKEICRLMCFPDEFQFPDSLSDRRKYMVLGNSINIKVVSELIKILNSSGDLNFL